VAPALALSQASRTRVLCSTHTPRRAPSRPPLLGALLASGGCSTLPAIDAAAATGGALLGVVGSLAAAAGQAPPSLPLKASSDRKSEPEEGAAAGLGGAAAVPAGPAPVAAATPAASAPAAAATCSPAAAAMADAASETASALDASDAGGGPLMSSIQQSSPGGRGGVGVGCGCGGSSVRHHHRQHLRTQLNVCSLPDRACQPSRARARGAAGSAGCVQVRGRSQMPSLLRPPSIISVPLGSAVSEWHMRSAGPGSRSTWGGGHGGWGMGWGRACAMWRV
jgi:hypothetical protein